MNHSQSLRLFLAIALLLQPLVSARAQRITDESQTGDPKLDYKLRSARAESEYDEICDSADEIVHIAADISKQLETGARPENQPLKPLDRLRKLARKVRSQLGGSGDPRMENPPAQDYDAAAALLERSRALADELHSSTRYEVNARVILLSGEIVYLVDLLRRFRGLD